MHYLFLASGIFLVWTISIIIAYFSLNIHHAHLISSGNDTLGGLVGYWIFIAAIYGLYRWRQVSKNPEYTILSFWHITGAFILQLFSVVILYNSSLQAPGGNSSDILTIFIHIISLLIFPIFLAFLFRALGASLLYWWYEWKHSPLRLRVLVETALGLGIWSFGLLILGGTGNYTLFGLLGLGGILTVASFTGWITIYKDIRAQKITLSHTSTNTLGSILHPRVLSTEIPFLIFGFVASISLISILRPMPIGWDDLGVYMNFPKIMAQTGEYLLGAGTYTWQLITGTGFLFENNAAQAFFINQMGGFFATIAIICALSLLLETPKTSQYISLPMLLGIVYYVMPMTIFQQAKDQKLDPILMFVSVTAILTLWYGIKTIFHNTKKPSIRYGYSLIALAGFLVGIAFSIKFTTLMLIISSIGFMSYRFLGISGFIGWMSLFIAVFTGFNLWGKLFVWMPEDTTIITLIASIVGVVGIGYGAYKKKSLRRWILACTIFGVGLLTSMLPWVIKNGVESGFPQHISIDSFLNGSGGIFHMDYTSIYSPEEIQERMDTSSNFTLIDKNGKTLNEDFSRYFGQESGLNNYLKLPIHLTLQKNQGGEFTDITFIFLALTPVLLLFLRAKHGREFYWLAGVTFFLILGALIALHVVTGISGSEPIFSWITPFLASITLPGGYLILIVLILAFAILVEYCLDETDPQTQHAKDMIFFLLLYGLIFWVSGFGIVWYGIAIYFFMLVIIGLGALRFTSYKEGMLENIRTLHILLSGALVCFLCIYHIAGTLPHSWKTLRTSGFHEYRNKMLDQESSIFAYRSEYLLPIATLNLKDPRQALLAAIESSPTLQQTGNIADTVSLTDFHHTLLQQYQAIHTSRKLSLAEKKQQMSELKRISHAFYSTILYPKPDQENTAPIYRIGTFMTYFIHKNRSRYLDDSLIVQFDQYFYDENPEVTIKRMRDMGIKYLLVDLNAATIDKDPRRALTTRYEHLLATMRAKNLKLIATDNPCLQFGLNRWHAQKITSLQEYLDLVGTNYESYHEHNGVLTQIPRTHKQNHCASTLITTINSGEQVDTSHPLRTIINGIHASKNQRDIQQTLMPIAQSWFALFEIIDLPMETSVNINPTETPSDTLSSTGISSGTKNRKELTETGNIEK